MEKKKMLDLVVNHYDEPWEIGKRFFDMIEYQRRIDFDDIQVTLVQDGQENTLDWEQLLGGYSYPIQVVTTHDHVGPAVARNAAFEHTSADWIMFCDFDDSFCDLAALSVTLANFPTSEHDVISMKYAKESKWQRGIIYINTIKESEFETLTAKMYRRAFLDEHQLRFDPRAGIHYEYTFNALVLAATKPHLLPMMISEFFPYIKTFRPDGYQHRLENFRDRVSTMFYRDWYLADQLDAKGDRLNRRKYAAQAAADVYFTIYNPDSGDKVGYPDGFWTFLENYRNDVMNIPKTEMDVILSFAEDEAVALIQRYFNEHGAEYYFQNDTVGYWEWLETAEKELNHFQKTQEDAAQKEVVAENKQTDVTQKHGKHKTGNVIMLDTEPKELNIKGMEREMTHAILEDLVVRSDEKQRDDTENERTEPKQAEALVKISNPKVVVYCGTYNVYMNMVASLKSLLATTPVDKVYFLIEDDVFPYELPDIVECINVKNQQYFDPNGPNFDNSWTWMCLMRAAYPEIFTQYDQILSLDIDIVVKDNVSDLWDYDMTDYYLAGVPERQRQKSASDPLYINFGVVMMNLKKLREGGVYRKIIEGLNTTKFDCPEQSAFNKYCAGKILELPNDYNSTVYSHITGEALNERILHYAGQRFWRHYSQVKAFGDLGWGEIMRRQNALREGRI